MEDPPVEAPAAPEGLLSTEHLDTEVAELSVLDQAQLSLANVSNMTLQVAPTVPLNCLLLSLLCAPWQQLSCFAHLPLLLHHSDCVAYRADVVQFQALTSMAEKAVEMKEAGVAGAGQLLDDISLKMRAMVTAAQHATGFMASREDLPEDTTQIASPRSAPVPVETAPEAEPEAEAKTLSVKDERLQAEEAANVKAAEKAAFEARQLERMQEKMKKAEEKDGSLSPKSRSSAAEEKKAKAAKAAEKEAFEARNLERMQAKLKKAEDEGRSPSKSPKQRLPSPSRSPSPKY